MIKVRHRTELNLKTDRNMKDTEQKTNKEVVVESRELKVIEL